MKHTFDIEIARIYGINAAIILENIGFWVKKNEANGENFYNGAHWTYNSVKAFSELFPYMSEHSIRRAIERLESCGLILTGKFNKKGFDRTSWYTLTERGKDLLQYGGLRRIESKNVEMTDLSIWTNRVDQNDKSICPNEQIELTKLTNPFVQNDKPIPYINTVINADINADEAQSNAAENVLDILKGNVPMTQCQMKHLLDMMPLDVFDHYLDRMSNFIDKGGMVRNACETMERWYKEDSRCEQLHRR